MIHMDALCLNLTLWSASSFPTFFLTDSVEPLETSVLPKSAFRRMRVSSMAIRRLNTTVQPMNDKLSALVSADLSSSIYCLFLGGIVATGALSSATFYIPATIGIMNDMMRRTSHTITPCVHWDSRLHNRPHRDRFLRMSTASPSLQSSPHTVRYGCQAVQHALLYGLHDEGQDLMSDCC